MEIDDPQLPQQQISTQPLLDLLPDELFQRILLYIPWRNRFRLFRVDHRFQRLTSMALNVSTRSIDHDRDWRKIPFDRMKPTDFQRVLLLVADGLRELDLTKVMSPKQFVSDVIAIRQFASLRVLNCSAENLSNKSFVKILDACPNLKEINVSVIWWRGGGGNLPTATSNASSSSSMMVQQQRCFDLETLHLTVQRGTVNDQHLISMVDYFPKLTRFYLTSSGFLTNTCLSSFVERYADRLIAFGIAPLLPTDYGGGPRHMVGGFDGIGQCPNLEELRLTGAMASHVTSAQFADALVRGCPRMETLHLGDFDGLTSEILAKLAGLPNLRNLALENKRGEWDDGLRAIAREGRLEQLALLGSWPRSTTAALKTCVRHCPNLTILSIEDLPWYFNVNDAVELAELYGRYSRAPRFRIRSRSLSIFQSAQFERIRERFRKGEFDEGAQIRRCDYCYLPFMEKVFESF